MATLIIELSEAQLHDLEELAKNSHRSSSAVAVEAISNYLEYKEWKIRAIKRGLESAERGEWISDEAMDAWLASWGTDDELPPPEIGD